MAEEAKWYLLVKRLQKSDLGLFKGPRQVLDQVGAGRQRSITMHIDVLKQVFQAHELYAGEIGLHEYYDTGDKLIGPNRRPLLRQHKNWRLAGDMVRAERFDGLQSGDFMLLLLRRHGAGKWLMAWDTVGQADEDLVRLDLLEQLRDLCEQEGMRLLNEGDSQSILEAWRAVSPNLVGQFLSDSTSPEPLLTTAKVTSRVEKNLMDLYLTTVVGLAPKDQTEFVRKLTKLAELFRKLLADDILKIDRDHNTQWKGVSGKRIGFVDGGSANIHMLGSEPLAIRVGTYTVVPGDASTERERFEMYPQLVDQLFGPDGQNRVFTADPDEEQISKVRDMARISLETAAAVQTIRNHQDLHYLFVHGPLVNPVSPYEKCPTFSDDGLLKLNASRSEIRSSALKHMDLPPDEESHFISTYFHLLSSLFASDCPVAGVIERSSMSRVVALSIIKQRRGASRRLYDRVDEEMRRYRINDAMLFAAVLQKGEYIRPFEIDKNELRRASPHWEKLIAEFPKPWTTYVMLRDTALPVRVELTRGEQLSDYKQVLSLIYHMSLLLPLYAFPVGLDIVDKYAKVPAWMSRQLSKHQAGVLLREALNSGDIDLYNRIRLMLTQNTREWFLRPKHEI